MEDQIDELTLLLLHLTSFPDDDGLGVDQRRSWKGYPFESLNYLSDNHYIGGSKQAKSVYLTDDGIKKARELMKKYHVEEK